MIFSRNKRRESGSTGMVLSNSEVSCNKSVYHHRSYTGHLIFVHLCMQYNNEVWARYNSNLYAHYCTQLSSTQKNKMIIVDKMYSDLSSSFSEGTLCTEVVMFAFSIVRITAQSFTVLKLIHLVRIMHRIHFVKGHWFIQQRCIIHCSRLTNPVTDNTLKTDTPLLLFPY